jgi:hypothetical protein
MNHAKKTVNEAGQTKIGAYARRRHHKCIYRGTQRNWKADGIKGAISRVDTYDDSMAVF